MKVGMTLPQFRDDAGACIDTARRAEAAGLDGVFVFDHLWPIGRPDRPALAGPVLAAALLVETQRVAVGTLVARVGLLPDAVLVATMATLARMAGSRLIAGLGIGDRLSRAENRAYGVALVPRPERLSRLAGVCRQLRAAGVTTWVGARSEETLRVGRAEAGAVNLWGAGAAEVAVEAVAAAGRAEVTWAGQVDLGSVGRAGLAALLQEVAAAGATWAVVAPVGSGSPEAVESVAAASGALVD
ncbi:MAG: LLM class flavin-dependent oxidoreductase [Actinomycetota bacterium]